MVAGLLLALTYIGGESAQITMSLPASTTRVFQGLLLFYLLGTDLFVNFRLRWMTPSVAKPTTVVEQAAE